MKKRTQTRKIWERLVILQKTLNTQPSFYKMSTCTDVKYGTREYYSDLLTKSINLSFAYHPLGCVCVCP